MVGNIIMSTIESDNGENMGQKMIGQTLISTGVATVCTVVKEYFVKGVFAMMEEIVRRRVDA